MKEEEIRVSQRELHRLHVEALLHGNRGKQAWNKTALEDKEKVIKLARGQYQGLNDTHLMEKLKDKEQISLSRPTVRRVLRAAVSPRCASAGSSGTTRGGSEERRRERWCYGTVARIVGLERNSGSGV